MEILVNLLKSLQVQVKVSVKLDDLDLTENQIIGRPSGWQYPTEIWHVETAVQFSYLPLVSKNSLLRKGSPMNLVDALLAEVQEEIKNVVVLGEVPEKCTRLSVHNVGSIHKSPSCLEETGPFIAAIALAQWETEPGYELP